MNEQTLIQLVAGKSKRSKHQKNKLNESDAELIDINGELWALTLDQFSPQEDLFTSNNPEILGSNLATATLSDLYAAGAKPEFFLQGLTLPKNVDSIFVRKFSKGFQKTLSNANCFLCGGDIGTEEDWRYSGFAMGRVRGNRPLMRIFSRRSHSIWVTGQLGDANLAALEKKMTPKFELRHNEAKLIHENASACMDTSGGLIDAIWWFHKLNPFLRFEIDLNNIPWAKGVIEASKYINVPPEAFLLGGAGEYELIFAIPEPISKNALKAMTSIQVTKIGTAMPDNKPGVYFFNHKKNIILMKDNLPCPRKCENNEIYINKVIKLAKKIFGEK
ncbi:MAG: Thiamine-monophosphate kinase [uncultured bacterium]|nr:MAG: Thiamine-monophosphate kinase [uncultured bacterium]